MIMSQIIRDRKSTRLNSSHTEIYTLSLHDALPILLVVIINETSVCTVFLNQDSLTEQLIVEDDHVTDNQRSEEHTSELQSHRDLHSFPTRRSSDLAGCDHQRNFCLHCVS